MDFKQTSYGVRSGFTWLNVYCGDEALRSTKGSDALIGCEPTVNLLGRTSLSGGMFN
jgi:hypothetical protein